MDEEKSPVSNRPTTVIPVVRPKRKSGFMKRRRKLLFFAFILLLAIGSAVFFYTKYQDSQYKLNNPEIVARAETESLVVKVGKLVELPSDEEPTVATVSDVSKLSSQTFFASAKNGDKVLIYSKARKAVLYRPSQNIVINVAPLNVNDAN